jgi:hypothetical protein
MTLEKIDEILATGPFGDAAALLHDRDVLYAGAARVLHLPAPATAAPDSHDEALTRTLARVRLDRALFGQRPPDVPTRPDGDPPATDAPRAGVPGTATWLADLTRPTAAQDAYTRLLGEALTFQGLTVDCGSGSPPAAATERTTAAMALAARLLPGAAATTFPFVHHCVLLPMRIPSMNLPQVPESVFVSTDLLAADLVRLADAVLHESLHEKMIVLRLTRTLMRPGYDDATSATFLLPWSIHDDEPRHFNAGRIISAAHVYTHLSALYLAALEDGDAPTELTTAALGRRLAEAYERGACLLDAVGCDHVRDEFGADGHELAGRLRDVLTEIAVRYRGPVALRPHPWPDLPTSHVIRPSRGARHGTP